MKFKFEKLEVGSKVEVVDHLGKCGTAEVIEINPTEEEPIRIRFTKKVQLTVDAETGETWTFKKGHTSTYLASGLYLENDPNGLKITRIKKPWKPLDGQVTDGMKVRVRYMDRWVKGVVNRWEHYSEVQFEEILEIWDKQSSARIDYYHDGTVKVPASLSALAAAGYRDNLNIREFK